MKNILTTIMFVCVLAGTAMAQEQREQQVFYPPYLANSGLTQQDLVNRQNYIIAQEQARLEGRYNIVRDPYASFQPGRIPMHPGDYRDAFDRGELPNLGNSRKPNYPIGR